MHDRPAHHAGEKKTLRFSHRLASFHAAWKRPGGSGKHAENYVPTLEKIT